MNDFAGRIRAWRAGRRQKEAAPLLGISIRTLQQWEYGINEPDQIKMVEIERRMAATAEKESIKPACPKCRKS